MHVAFLALVLLYGKYKRSCKKIFKKNKIQKGDREKNINRIKGFPNNILLYPQISLINAKKLY